MTVDRQKGDVMGTNRRRGKASDRRVFVLQQETAEIIQMMEDLLTLMAVIGAGGRRG